MAIKEKTDDNDDNNGRVRIKFCVASFVRLYCAILTHTPTDTQAHKTKRNKREPSHKTKTAKLEHLRKLQEKYFRSFVYNFIEMECKIQAKIKAANQKKKEERRKE